jgi:hypothetical protein
MKLTDEQGKQLPPLLHKVIDELRNRCEDPKAVADLAYAAHNLPFLATTDHFDLAEIRFLFKRFHEDHDYLLYDFVELIDLLEKGRSIKNLVFNTPRNRDGYVSESAEGKETG